MDIFVLISIIIVVFAATMYVRVELDFKRNVFRLFGHSISTALLLLLALALLGVVSQSIPIWWFLFASVYLFVNELIRIYLRRHRMSDILQNHPRLYWLTRGKLRRSNASTDRAME